MIDATTSEWQDISVPVAPGRTPTWPGAPAIEFRRWLDVDRGDEATDTVLTMSVHTGTHIDAPSHFLGGEATTDRIPLSALMGPCHVADLRGASEVTASALEGAGVPEGTTRLLVRTDNSARWSQHFEEDFVGLSANASQYLVERGVRAVGIDYLSVQPLRGSRAVHDILLEASVVIVEGLNLLDVAAGSYELLCLPLALVGCEGAPARALIRPLHPQGRSR